MKRWFALGAVLGVAGVTSAAACGSTTCADTKTCDDGTNPNGGDGGPEASVEGSVGAETGPPAECVVSPSANAEVLSDKCGVFVSPTGSDTNAGTKASPFRSVEQATKIAKSSSGKAWVFVCQGTYTEAPLVVEGDLGVYGKLDCAGGTWSVGTTRAVIKGRDAGKPVFTFNKSKARLEGVEINAPDAVDPGQSSIGVFANEGELSVVGSVITAGKGKDGDPGANGGAPAAKASAGNPPTSSAGGGPKICSCGDGQTAGGSGGSLNFQGGNGLAGEPDAGVVSAQDGAGGIGGSGTCLSANGNAHDGAAGAPGAAGANAKIVGTTTFGWLPTPGGTGAPGSRGQGGGGAGAKLAHGGSGGCGGCGGLGGTGGQGGGASVALMVVSTAVAIRSSEFMSVEAGKGGAGGMPQVGQPGGGGGAPLADSCLAGTGGTGGTGGNGGGGAGGISAGIAFKGLEPQVDPTSKFTFPVIAAKGGAGGSGAVKDGAVAAKLAIN